ncbi:MAG: hypothetical protein M1282_11075 [Chloroflexi bacterium]|nr:hypothetical protein [Chloroflexota bacterium]
MAEHLIDIRVVQPGRTTGHYYSQDLDSLRLEKIVYPEASLPFDVCILPTAFTPFDEPFPVLALGDISHPLNTEMEARLLGAVQRGEENPILLAVPSADERSPQCLENLTTNQRAEIVNALNTFRPGEWRWLTNEEVEPHLHVGTKRYRQFQASDKPLQLDPSWKPLHIGRPEPSFAEAERYTAAEYTFYELPYRFQHYVNEHLAPDERILYAARRPAMLSRRKRSLLQREQMQAGVLILTNQRLIQLVELVPPDSANIRYGFHATVGVLERLSQISLQPLESNLILRSEWRAEQGSVAVEWEVPGQTRAALEELVGFLQRFQVNADDCVLRRATVSAPPEVLPALADTASNDPEYSTSLNKRFHNSLIESLMPDEQAYAWALLPEWLDRKQGAQALVVTGQRLLLLPDHSFDVSLSEVATIEYTSSILESSLGVNYTQKGAHHRKTIYFPYPARDSFRDCFEAARRCMAVIAAV